MDSPLPSPLAIIELVCAIEKFCRIWPNTTKHVLIYLFSIYFYRGRCMSVIWMPVMDFAERAVLTFNHKLPLLLKDEHRSCN